MLVAVLLDTSIFVHYGFLTLTGIDEDPGERADGYRGQVNGLCGAAQPGVLHLHTGLHTGNVGVRIELHTDEPDLDDASQDVVQAYFSTLSEDLMLSAFDSVEGPVDLPPGFYRVRYCGQDMQRGDDGEAVDCYVLQFWPANGVDRIVRQSSTIAGYRHSEGTEPAWISEELAARVSVLRQNRADRLAEEAAEELQEVWDGDVPDDPRLHEGGWGAATLLQVDPTLTLALVDADDDLRRAVSAWCAERILAAAGLLDRPWSARVLAALRDGTPLPDRFEVTDTLPPMPIAPGFGDDHAVDQHGAVEAIFNAAVSISTFAAACEMCLVAREQHDSLEFTADIRNTFGQLFKR